MRRSSSEYLSDAQVVRLEKRRKSLNLTRDKLLQKFDRALRNTGCAYDDITAAKMRLDRVFNSRMRKPISEATKAALAQALDLTLEQFDQLISQKRRGPTEKASKGYTQASTVEGQDGGTLADQLRRSAETLKAHARELDTLARTLVVNKRRRTKP
jgi:transcriptional regulator with XRE-family HTH domain